MLSDSNCGFALLGVTTSIVTDVVDDKGGLPPSVALTRNEYCLTLLPLDNTKFCLAVISPVLGLIFQSVSASPENKNSILCTFADKQQSPNKHEQVAQPLLQFYWGRRFHWFKNTVSILFLNKAHKAPRV